MRIGIYGGSFDPVHYGHLLLAEACREQCRLDEVWFLPAAVAPHKRDREPAAAEHRAAMLDLATAGHQAFRVSRYELDRGGVNYTVETLEHFAAEEPSRELFLLVGADMLNDLPNWRRASDVCRLALPVAVRRGGSPPPDFACLGPLVAPERFDAIRAHAVAMPEIGLSSTLLRQHVAEGRSIRFMTPRAVEMYIDTAGLYWPADAKGD